MTAEVRMLGGPEDGRLRRIPLPAGRTEPPQRIKVVGCVYVRDHDPIARAGQPALWMYRAVTGDTGG